MVKKILLFGFDALPEILAIRDAAAPFGAEPVTVSPKDTGKTLAVLAGLEEEGRAPAAALPVGRMLVLCGLQDQLDGLLPALAGAGAGQECLKAVLTSHNRAWSAGRLYQELLREREAIRRGRKP